MSKYEPLKTWLEAMQSGNIKASFGQIELVLGFGLPKSARTRPAWWSNEGESTRHVQCRAWIEAGFVASNLSLGNETIEFVRI